MATSTEAAQSHQRLWLKRKNPAGWMLHLGNFDEMRSSPDNPEDGLLSDTMGEELRPLSYPA